MLLGTGRALNSYDPSVLTRTTLSGSTDMSVLLVSSDAFLYVSIHTSTEYLASLNAIQCNIDIGNNYVVSNYISQRRFTTPVFLDVDVVSRDTFKTPLYMFAVIPIIVPVGVYTNSTNIPNDTTINEPLVISIEVVSLVAIGTETWGNSCFKYPWNMTWSWDHLTCYPTTTSVWQISTTHQGVSNTSTVVADAEKVQGDTGGAGGSNIIPGVFTPTSTANSGMLIAIAMTSLVCGVCMMLCRKIKDGHERDCLMKEQEALGEFPPLEIVDSM
jgi:hypothetical protein